MNRAIRVVVTSLAAVLLVTGCVENESVKAPEAPLGLQAAPGNGTAALSWAPSAGATSYRVYYATSPSVTSSSARISAAGTSVSVPSLSNGTPYWFAVAALNDGGESPLSLGACAVPTVGVQAELTLLDGLCGTTLSGASFWPSGLATARVVNGAAELSAGMDDMEPFAANGAQYNSAAMVMAGGVPVTTLRGTIAIPSGSVVLSGAGAQARAVLRLVFSPPSKRFSFPLGSQDTILFEAGLMETGAGLKAFRQISHCDDASCATFTTTGIAFSDPSGWVDGPSIAPATLLADAAYDTAYSVELRLDTITGIFHWGIAGGSFGAGVSGTADPTEYLTGAGSPASWSGISLNGTGFAGAQMGVRTRDSLGGGSGQVVARYDDLEIGTYGGPPVPHDDFSGAGDNSGPELLSNARWSPGGSRSISMPGGSLAMSLKSTSAGSQAGCSQSIAIANPAAVNALQADVRFASWSAGSEPQSYAGATVRGRFYSDGSGSVPGSALGDVVAAVTLRAKTNDALYSIQRCTNATCQTTSPVASAFLPGVTVGSGVHTVLLRWDPAAKRFTFRVDSEPPVEVDPTPTAPYAGPANSPMRDLMTTVIVPATVGSTSSLDVRVNNVFTGP